MAKKISKLTQATEVKSDDVTVIVQDGETKKLPLNMMVTKQDIENKKVAGLAKLDEIEATYENDTYTPTITVKNKSSVKTGEGDGVDYSANVMDGPAKSAILKGQTLVNIFPHLQNDNYLVDGTNSVIIDENIYKVYHSTTANYSIRLKTDVFATKMKSNTDYTLIINIIESTITKTGVKLGISTHENLSCIDATNIIGTARVDLGNTVGFFKEKVRLKDDLRSTRISDIYFCFWDGTGNDTEYVKFKVILLEGDYTNVDIPYFEGMQSVKMPVLTTTGGKNFSPVNSGSIKRYTGVQENHKISDIKLAPNEKYTLSFNSDISTLRIFLYDETGKEIFQKWEPGSITFQTNKCENYYLVIYTFYDGDYTFSELQIEQGSVATPYEPYKSNILTVNEDITLRGIGNVQDTLDCLTGEVTQRIGEIVADGVNFKFVKVSQNAEQYDDGSVRFDLQELNDINTKVSNNWEDASKFIINDRLKTGFFPTFANTKEKDVISMWNKTLVIVFSDTNIRTVKQANDWLKQNPITIQYQLSEEYIKTVDLMPSGTHPSTTPYCWKNGHIQLSSSGLLPNLEYSVVTSRAGQINQNATMIVKNDKRIFDLEILLAGGLVNTTYQALTLQNQVETGLSKVSLSSETEPDYLLYHMIMKLIEEKAYKLDDLTEKVSVFYLYEKLSDEQFETIYSALYPFVEDEIVEEPVVEELPEVVEDEVIM